MAELTFWSLTRQLAERISSVRTGSVAASPAPTASSIAIENDWLSFVSGELEGGTIWMQAIYTPAEPPEDPQKGRGVVSKIVSNTASVINLLPLRDDYLPVATSILYVANRDYPLDILSQALNGAVRDLVQWKMFDASLASVANQLDYDVPYENSDFGPGRIDIDRVEVELEEIGGEKHYQVHQHWDQEVPGTLHFAEGFAPAEDGREIRLTYRVRASEEIGLEYISVSGDIWSYAPGGPYSIDPELLLWKAAANALRWGLGIYGTDSSRRIVERLNEAQQEIARRAGNKRISHRDTVLGNW